MLMLHCTALETQPGQLRSALRWEPSRPKASKPALLWGALDYLGRKIEAPPGDEKLISQVLSLLGEATLFLTINSPSKKSSKNKPKTQMKKETFLLRAVQRENRLEPAGGLQTLSGNWMRV